LRFDVISGESGVDGQGWALLVRRGMCSWCDSQQSDTQKQKKLITVPNSIVTESFEQSLVEVFAGMVLNLQSQEVCHV